jgi:hypothetical protein
MRNWVHAATAVAVLGAVAFVAPQSALACSGPVPTREEAVDAATLILAGRVVSKPGEWAYELDVEEVFRGPQSDTIVIGDLAPATPPICSHQLEVGDRVVVALRDPTNLGLFSSAVWLLLPDGTFGSIAPEPPAATHDELFTYLRVLPDTSMPTEKTRSSLLRTLGVVLLGASLVFGVSRHAWRDEVSSRTERSG